MTQVFGEEILEIPFSNGLYISESDDDIPDGFNAIQKNMLIDEKGHLNLRASFQTAGVYIQPAAEPREATEYVVPQELYPPDYPFDYLRRVHYPYNRTTVTPGSPTTYVNFPSIVLPRLLNITGADTIRFHHVNSSNLNGNTEETQTVVSTAFAYLSACCQYRDRIYFSGRIPPANTQGTVKYMTGWDYDGTPGNISGNNIVTEPAFGGFACGLDGMITFRDRIFGWNGNRIHYTEVAAVGGYPETFSANNIIHVQSTESSCTIHNIIALKDKLYIFTDRGLYQMYAVGPPSGWYLQTISTEYRIFGRNGACVVNDTLVFTDRKKIYVYGDTFQVIGAEIDLIMTAATSVTVVPFESGVIVSCHEMLPHPTAVSDYSINYWTLEAARHFYFDGSTWAEIEIWDDLGVARIFAILGGRVNHVSSGGESHPYSYLTIVDEVITTPDPTFYHLYYDNETLNEDLINGDSCQIEGHLRTKKYRNTKPTALIRIKHAYINFMTYLAEIRSFGWIKDASTSVEDVFSSDTLTPVAVDKSYMLRVKGTEIASKYAFNLRVNSNDVPIAPITDTPRTYFKLRNIWKAVNTDNTGVVNRVEP